MKKITNEDLFDLLSNINEKVNNLDLKVNNLDLKVNNLGLKVNNLDLKVNNLDFRVNSIDTGLKMFKEETNENFLQIRKLINRQIEFHNDHQHRIGILEVHTGITQA